MNENKPKCKSKKKIVIRIFSPVDGHISDTSCILINSELLYAENIKLIYRQEWSHESLMNVDWGLQPHRDAGY